ncbi:dienelactone hydrolase family protein [Cyanobacteria bacterium FACHB-471]|nr:dienelactone hydrolase family protein [Cyanobacteria bacterium FACHB-471]
MFLQAIALPSAINPPQGLFVALHGWGASAQDVASLAPMLHLPGYQMLFPDAPFPHPYAPQGKMWYSFPQSYTFQSNVFGNQPDLAKSRQQLTEWLKSLPEITGIPLSHTILAGFSQGGAMTLDVGTQLPLAALMILSGYLHAPLATQTSQFPPILMVHGRQDQVVPLRSAQQARDSLLGLGATVQYHELDMGHEIRPVVLELMQNFIREKVIKLGEKA